MQTCLQRGVSGAQRPSSSYCSTRQTAPGRERTAAVADVSRRAQGGANCCQGFRVSPTMPVLVSTTVTFLSCGEALLAVLVRRKTWRGTTNSKMPWTLLVELAALLTSGTAPACCLCQAVRQGQHNAAGALRCPVLASVARLSAPSDSCLCCMLVHGCCRPQQEVQAHHHTSPLRLSKRCLQRVVSPPARAEK